VTGGKTPLLATDIIIMDEKGLIVLIRRRYSPFSNHWAIPRGRVEYGETVEQAAIREAREETGLEVRIERLIGVYSNPRRDPRGHVVSIAFLAKQIGGELKAGTEAKEVKCFEKIPLKLAFDHKEILRDAFSVV